jgi:N-methylhydantoinase B
MQLIENDYPLTFQRYRFVPDSGGAGKTRGGLGLERSFRIDSPEGTFSCNFDRFRTPPYGLDGGAPGALGRMTLTRAGANAATDLSSKVSGLPVSKGDVLSLRTSGGGGYGDPGAR